MNTKDTVKGDMTVQEFYSGFNLDFLTPEERETIYTATEMFAMGKVRQATPVKSEGGLKSKEDILKIALDDWYDTYSVKEEERFYKAMEMYAAQFQTPAILAKEESNEAIGIDGDIRMILSHAFLGEDENISRQSFDLAVREIVNYIQKHLCQPRN